MSGLLKLNPLILNQIDSGNIPDKMKKLLKEILFFELKRSRMNEERYSIAYEDIIERYFSGKL